MKKLIIATLIAAPSFVSANSSIGFGYGQIKITPEAGYTTPAFSNKIATLDLNYKASKYIETSLFLGVPVDEDTLAKQTDTFRDISGGEIQTQQFKSIVEADYVAGAQLSFVMPTSSHLTFKVDVGYLTSPWESKGYLPFTDNEPAADFDQALADQLNSCEITGIEDVGFCGPLSTFEESGRTSGAYGGLTVDWAISKRTTVSFSGKKSVTDSKGEFDFFGAAIKFAW